MIMGSHFNIMSFVTLFLVTFASIRSEVHYYITPSQNDLCPQNPCLTLSQFAANSSDYLGNETNVSLFFLPGNHSLDQDIFLLHLHNFVMIKVVPENYRDAVHIECGNQFGRFTVIDIVYTTIKNLHFIGCGGNEVRQVVQFTVEDSVFQGMEGRFTALSLFEVTCAKIANTSFFSNAYRKGYIAGESMVIFAWRSLSFITSSIFTNNVAAYGGVIYAQESSFSIVQCIFTDNYAGAGGTIYAISGSSFNITNSIVRNNWAYFGGAIYAAIQSSFNIINSTFIDNGATDCGGVIYVDESSFSTITTTFLNNYSGYNGGVLCSNISSSFDVVESNFAHNHAYFGGVMIIVGSSFNLTKGIFTNNSASSNGGVFFMLGSSSTIITSTFSNNTAGQEGGVIYNIESSLTVIASSFNNNNASNLGGVIALENCSPLNKSVAYLGGVIFTVNTVNNTLVPIVLFVWVTNHSSVNIVDSSFSNNSANQGGVISAYESSFSTYNSTFSINSASDGGVIYARKSSFNITDSKFIYNIANRTFRDDIPSSDGVNTTKLNTSDSSLGTNIAFYTMATDDAANGTDFVKVIIANIMGMNSTTHNRHSSDKDSDDLIAGHTAGVISSQYSSSNIINSTFTMNGALFAGVIGLYTKSSFNITGCKFTNNVATTSSGVLSLVDSSTIIITNSTFRNNSAKYQGILSVIGSSMYILNCTFEHNIGSLYAIIANITFSGYVKFENCTEPTKETQSPEVILQEGGAITSYQSNLLFAGVSTLISNQAYRGGALSAIGSIVTILVSSLVIVANNTATTSTAGGIYLYQSSLTVFGNCHISHNGAAMGGGIHASSSTISVYQEGLLKLHDNRAEMAGGGLYMEMNPRINLLKYNESTSMLLIFHDNHAIHGGAVYVADNTSSGCLYDVECFIQTIALYDNSASPFHSITVNFDGNTATSSGPNLYGGLLDRCIPSQFAEVYKVYPKINNNYYTGVAYLGNISNIVLDSVSSLPVRVCFCDSERQPNCSYQPPTIKVMKGATFNVSLVAVDQVNSSVETNIRSSLAFPGGGFNEGQQSQKVTSNCTDLWFNIFSPEDSEILTLFPDGPCGSSAPSTQHLNVTFLNCTCPIGFEPSNSKPTACECTCDSNLLPYIGYCNSTSKSLVRVNTNSWITYVNTTDPPGYVIHPNCPFDYCHSQTEKVNFSLPDQADGQCAYNHTGILCGACRQNLSLSLGSSRCLPCSSSWLIILITLLLGSAIIGILLIMVLLILNITVTGGFITGIIFYANIIAASRSAFLPSAEPSFPSVLVAWLNLDIGFDLCFFDGLDMYTKTWLQLAFPAYIISLVIIVIKVSENSPKFTRLLGPGRRDPVATLATLTLLSYSKLLSTTIAALSYAELHYPDGSKVKVWLPDGNVQYLRGKHIALAVVAFLIILVGVPYTLLLFFWQWLIRSPNSKLFWWTKDTRLNAIITTYHAPYNHKHRYWMGLLLLVRVVLYITAALFQSSNPQIPLLATNILIGGVFCLKSFIGIRLHNVLVIDIMETVTLLNILCFSVSSLYNFKIDNKKQIVIGYTSTSITLLMLVGGVIYHIALLIKRLKKTRVEVEEYAMVPRIERTEVTYSIVERPTPEPPPTPPDMCSDNFDSNSISLAIENNDSQNESNPCEDHVVYPADIMDEKDTVPLLEIA